MEYNVLHQVEGYATDKYLAMKLEDRMTEVAKIINETAPDVLFLAERFEEWAGVGDGAVDLMAALNDHYAIIENTVTYSLTSGGTETVINRTPIVYNTDTFRVVESGYVFLTDLYLPESSNNKRCVTWAILEDVTDSQNRGKRIAVFGTHWSVVKHWTTGESLEYIRVIEAEEVAALVNSEKFAGLPTVVGGDFNAHYTVENKTECYVKLLEQAGLTDASASKATALTPYIFGGVDHIAVKQCAVTHFTVIWNTTDYASDHDPIYCDIKIETFHIGGT